MPSYELSLILRKMARSELIDALKRTGIMILKKECVLKKIENLGARSLPHKMSVHGQVHKEGNYFVLYFDSSTHTLKELQATLTLDIDIIKSSLQRLREISYPEECTLEEEFQPPALRKSVQKLIEKQKKPKRRYVFRKYTDEI